MLKVSTYLSFDGSAAEAMRFYEGALGAKLDVLMRFGDIPVAEQIPPGSAGRVMHAQLAFADGGALMASDWIGEQPYEGMRGFSVALSYQAADEARRVFDALADGGTLVLPLQPSFFAEAFGMVIDRFGTPWSVSGGGTKPG
jgi:PhnB protein